MDKQEHHQARSDGAGRSGAGLLYPQRANAQRGRVVRRDVGTATPSRRHGRRAAVFAAWRVQPMAAEKREALPQKRTYGKGYRPQNRTYGLTPMPQNRTYMGLFQHFLCPKTVHLLELPSVEDVNRRGEEEGSTGSQARAPPKQPAFTSTKPFYKTGIAQRDIKMDNFQTIRAVMNGKEHMLGIWRTKSNGNFETLYKIAHDTKREIESFTQRTDKIQSDPRRTALAMKEDVTATAGDSLKHLGGLQQHLNQEKAKVNARAASLSTVTPYQANDVATPLIDLEISRMLRDMPDAKRAATLSGVGDQRVRDAVLRLPPTLTGVTPEQHARLQRQTIEAMHPRDAAEIADLQTAIEDAQVAVKKAWKILSLGVDLEDQVKAAGSDAKELMSNVSPIAVENISNRLEASEK